MCASSWRKGPTLSRTPTSRYALLHRHKQTHTRTRTRTRTPTQHGADIHAEGDEALKWAALRGHTELVRFLLEKGADPSADSHYPIHMARRNGHTEVVSILVEYGEDPNAPPPPAGGDVWWAE